MLALGLGAGHGPARRGVLGGWVRYPPPCQPSRQRRRRVDPAGRRVQFRHRPPIQLQIQPYQSRKHPGKVEPAPMATAGEQRATHWAESQQTLNVELCVSQPRWLPAH